MLKSIVDWVVYSFLNIDSSSHFGKILNFFIYDSIKVIILLFTMISVIGLLRTFISQNKIKSWVTKQKILGNIYASFFGIITPFCSCSSIPIFIGFIKTGIPLGVSFSFLITSPLINEYLMVLMFGFFGWKITLAYIISGMTIGVVTGAILGKMKLEKHLEEDIASQRSEEYIEIEYHGKERIIFGINEAKSIVKKLWAWILIGVGVGALIHNYVPESAIQAAVSKAGVFSVPIVVIIGVPMYGSCAAILPIAVVLFEKGVPLGTALAFMMATSALSLPEAVMLRRTMNLKLITIFFGITTLGIIFIGYLFNILQEILI